MAPRWKRRNRLYATFALLALVYPLALLYHINFDASGALALGEKFPGRTATFTTLLNVFAVGTWLLILSRFFLAPLEAHRRGDRPLQREMAALRSRASKQRPRFVFYLCGFFALLLMALWIVWRR